MIYLDLGLDNGFSDCVQGSGQYRSDFGIRGLSFEVVEIFQMIILVREEFEIGNGGKRIGLFREQQFLEVDC